MKQAVFFAVLAALLAFSSGARRADNFNDVERFMGSSAGGSLHSSAKALIELMRRGKKDVEKGNAIFTVKFYVPPSESKNFEDRWLDYHKVVDKKEETDIHHLMKAKLINDVYFSYGEFENSEDLTYHFTSEHFKDFSDWVDEHDIKWDMELLKSLSTDIEKEQKKKRMERRKKGDMKDAMHVLHMYYVPPGEGYDFMNAWTDSAEKTILEEENLMYSLRKVATDNTRYFNFGTWESHESYRKHYGSDHHLRFMDYTTDKDITWVVIPLEHIGGMM